LLNSTVLSDEKTPAVDTHIQTIRYGDACLNDFNSYGGFDVFVPFHWDIKELHTKTTTVCKHYLVQNSKKLLPMFSACTCQRLHVLKQYIKNCMFEESFLKFGDEKDFLEARFRHYHVFIKTS